MDEVDTSGQDCVFRACHSLRLETVKLLHELGCPLSRPNDIGITPLLTASKKGKKKRKEK